MGCCQAKAERCAESRLTDQRSESVHEDTVTVSVQSPSDEVQAIASSDPQDDPQEERLRQSRERERIRKVQEAMFEAAEAAATSDAVQFTRVFGCTIAEASKRSGGGVVHGRGSDVLLRRGTSSDSRVLQMAARSWAYDPRPVSYSWQEKGDPLLDKSIQCGGRSQHSR